MKKLKSFFLVIAMLISLTSMAQYVKASYATAAGTPYPPCVGQKTYLYGEAVGYGPGTYTYTWTSVPAGFAASSPNCIAYPQVPTQYFCKITQNGVDLGTPSVNVPVVSVTCTVSNTSIVQGGCGTLTVIPSGGSSYSYQWSGSAIQGSSTGLAVTACPTISSMYNVTVTEGGGCKANGQGIITVTGTTTGIEPIEKLEDGVYPNPVKAGEVINLSSEHSEKSIIFIYNMTGAVVKKEESDLIIIEQPGLYFYVVKNRSGIVKSGKLLVL